MTEKEEILQKSEYGFADLVKIIRILRAPGGCPWDRAQTHSSIRANLIEETYELVEGIDKDDKAIMREELGNVLLQILLHADMSAENGDLNLRGICLVAGLGPENNTRRDGSYEYYISEPVVDNDAKGVGPFIMAYTEVKKLK